VDDVYFEFYATDAFDEDAGDPKTNKNIRIIHINSDDSTSNVIITGYLEVGSIDATLTHPLYLDDIITVS
jgi:hypothetical protein